MAVSKAYISENGGSKIGTKGNKC